MRETSPLLSFAPGRLCSEFFFTLPKHLVGAGGGSRVLRQAEGILERLFLLSIAGAGENSLHGKFRRWQNPNTDQFTFWPEAHGHSKEKIPKDFGKGEEKLNGELHRRIRVCQWGGWELDYTGSGLQEKVSVRGHCPPLPTSLPRLPWLTRWRQKGRLRRRAASTGEKCLLPWNFSSVLCSLLN